MDNEQAEGRGRSAGIARRGALAALMAAVAGVLAKASERVAQAAGNGSPLIMGNNDNTTNNPTNTTRLVRGGGGADAGFYVLEVVNNNTVFDVAMAAQSGNSQAFAAGSDFSFGFGVAGFTFATGLPGTVGYASPTDITGQPGHVGVLGYSQQNAAGIGVRGDGRAYGVQGVASTRNGATGNGTGVLGQSQSGVGVQGSSNGNVGVLGSSNASHGLFGSSTNGFGLYATSTNNTAIVASTNGGNAIQGASNGNVGVLGTSGSSIGGYFASGTATGLYATGPGTGFAARFDGPVLVNGNFTAIGGAKSAAVPHPDGSYRRLYAVESPESWFEDFGREQLVNGRARVRLDPDFDAVVRGDDYYVFLTEHGDQGGLFVENVGPHAFTVRARNATANGPFSYRVVAKRRDIPGRRLEKVDIPLVAPERPAAPPPPPIVPAVPPLPDPNAPPRMAPRSGPGRER
jgi:hypothetical protein